MTWVTGQTEEKKEKEKEEKEEKKEEEKKLAHTGRTERDQPKVVQEVLADLKIVRSKLTCRKSDLVQQIAKRLIVTQLVKTKRGLV